MTKTEMHDRMRKASEALCLARNLLDELYTDLRDDDNPEITLDDVYTVEELMTAADAAETKLDRHIVVTTNARA